MRLQPPLSIWAQIWGRLHPFHWEEVSGGRQESQAQETVSVRGREQINSGTALILGPDTKHVKYIIVRCMGDFEF